MIEPKPDVLAAIAAARDTINRYRKTETEPYPANMVPSLR